MKTPNWLWPRRTMRERHHADCATLERAAFDQIAWYVMAIKIMDLEP
jgi:hypothetical protein